MPDVSAEPQLTSSQKSINWKRILIITVAGAVVIGLGVSIFLILQPDPETVKTPIKKATSSAKVSTPPAKKDETADWKSFTSLHKDISFKYPQTLFKGENYGEGSVYIVSFSNYKFKDDGGDSCEDKDDCFVLRETSVLSSVSKEYETVSGIDIDSSYIDDNPTGSITYTRQKNFLSNSLKWLIYDVEGGGKWVPKYSYNAHLKTEPYGFYIFSISSDYEAVVISNKQLLQKVVSTFKFLD